MAFGDHRTFGFLVMNASSLPSVRLARSCFSRKSGLSSFQQGVTGSLGALEPSASMAFSTELIYLDYLPFHLLRAYSRHNRVEALRMKVSLDPWKNSERGLSNVARHLNHSSHLDRPWSTKI